MATILIFSRIFFQNLEFIIPVVIFLSVVVFVGICLYLSLAKEDKWYLILPAGAITGLFGFIIILGNLGYFLKGRYGIAVIFLIYIILGVLLFRKIKKFPELKIRVKLKNIFLFIISFLFLGFLAFLVGANQYGGDVIAYWGFATSFANGNYPIYSPWQPDFLSIHHKGTYMFEGAIYALTSVDMKLIHTLYSYFVIASGFFLLWGWTRKIVKRDVVSILPALVAFFSWGGLFFPLPNSLRRYISPEVEHVTGRLPILLDAKNRLGGASNLPEVIYINHRVAAFSGVLFLLILIFSKFKIKERYKPAITAGLAVAIISSDEIYLPVILFIFLGWFIHELIKSKKDVRRSVVVNLFFAGIVFIFLFFTVENAIRNSLIVAHQEEARFRVVTSFQEMQKRLRSFRSAILRQSENLSYFWYLPDLRVIVLMTFVFAALSGDFWVLIFSVGAIGAVIAFFIISHTYYPGNNERFLHVIYHFYGICLTYSLVILLNSKKKLLRNIAKLILFVIVVPSIIFSLVYLYPRAKQPDYPNLYGNLPPTQVLRWMKKNQIRERVFFVDGFLRGLNHSPYTLQGIQNFGLMVPVSPAKIRVHTPDFGVEAFDFINTLNPKAAKELKLNFVFLTHDQFRYYPEVRLKDLENKNFFERVYEDNEGVLYKIKPTYLTEAENIGGGISDLSNLIEDNSNIYLDYPPRMDGALRAALLLVLRERGNIYTEWRSGAFNYIETKIDVKEPSYNLKYDYLVLAPSTGISKECNCTKANKIWQTNGLVLYEVKD